jgi:4-hydroxyphenylpyruvate dioxygenase
MNTIGLNGISFVEFSSHEPQKLEDLFLAFGFSKTRKHKNKNIDYFNQNDIHFLINNDLESRAVQFSKKHGPCISSMGWKFEHPQKAYNQCLQRGATSANGDLSYNDGELIPAIYGIGDSLIYFMKNTATQEEISALGMIEHHQPIYRESLGFTVIDHLTNNVEKGTMQKWADFYKNIFEFTEVRYFDIRGAKTGLTSYALKSPCGAFCIPINEASESKSQINEYLEEYHGAGIQHLAFLTEDILSSLDSLSNSKISVLDIDNEYYNDIFEKFPQVKEDHAKLKQHQILIDGDEDGYLLQIFTKNLIGPIFIEIIQRENHYSFGEGNFGALFRSIERDQIKRGYLKN